MELLPGVGFPGADPVKQRQQIGAAAAPQLQQPLEADGIGRQGVPECRILGLHLPVKRHQIPGNVVDGCPLWTEAEKQSAAAEERFDVTVVFRNHSIDLSEFPALAAGPFQKRLHAHPCLPVRYHIL